MTLQKLTCADPVLRIYGRGLGLPRCSRSYPGNNMPNLEDLQRIQGPLPDMLRLRNEYSQYVVETQTNGGQPVTFEEYVKGRGQ